MYEVMTVHFNVKMKGHIMTCMLVLTSFYVFKLFFVAVMEKQWKCLAFAGTWPNIAAHWFELFGDKFDSMT